MTTPGDEAQGIRSVGGLHVATLGKPEASRQVLLFMGFLACVEPFELQRFAVLAREWDAQVTVVDTPGYGQGGATLAWPERRGLLGGDFTAVARRLVRTAQEVHSRLRHGPVTLVGYSMGASLASAASADPGLVRVADMVLVEPVAIRHWNPIGLIGAVRSEDEVLDDYLVRNAEVPGAVPPAEHRGEPPTRRCPVDLGLLGYAISRGGIGRDLLRANAIQSFPVQIGHGVHSRLSRSGDVRRLVATCREAGIVIHDAPVAGRHALWHSLPDVTALARLIRAQWD
ncbi:alpha/beta fold hydrolase [Mycolicibacterium llatzerense]|uniref:alpha/beta fold hydrolase n=1 Tax=Mycolicibacterium llatzerense TaxID=280871 RepID=UPI0013A6EB71|nr:alpha/beta fold hydrolase [Mycolicibacterium llatzerense]